MNTCDLFDFGGHTVDHMILSQLSDEKKNDQIVQCKRTLESKLQKSVTLFSYPEGQRHHYDDKCIELLKKHGFISSPSAVFGFNTSNASPFHLYRNMVGFVARFKECIGEDGINNNK
jgi:peptidoglycan/xylan/chitin deacetylase (PgdA/CDA1 family)